MLDIGMSNVSPYLITGLPASHQQRRFGVRRAYDNGHKAELAVAAITGEIQDSA
jgi:hypothetical protein